MITLHESNITSFPQDNGIGVLRDVIRAYAEEELNGMFEFYMEYDSEGHLVDELKEERIVKAKAQDKLGYQLFRIYSITKNHENDNLIIRAQHITYDLANNFVEKMEANRLTKKQVMEKIGASTVIPHTFNITSSNTTTVSSTNLYRTNPLQMIAGMEGSVLQIWGGQIERDNFNLILHDRRGSDDGVKVTYEKNITGLEATFDISNLVTRIFPFVFIEESDNEPARLITVNGKYIDSPLINNYEKIYIKPIDYSHDERIDTQDKTDAQIRQQLEQVASRYFEETGNDKIKVEMEVSFEHLWETEEYKDLAVLELVGLGDTVTIEHSRLKVNATAIVNYIRYDCIAKKNEEVRLGSVKARLTDSVNRVVDVAEKAEQAQQTANQAIRAANGKNTIYYGPDEPMAGQKDDLWFRVVDGEYTRTYRHDGIQWQLVLSVDVRDAIDEAQQAKDEAQQAVDRANQATQQATNAINQAQTAFDEAQQALSIAGNAYDIATTLQGDVTNLSTLVDEHTGQISSITQSVTGLQTQVSDIEGNVSTLTQTVSSLTTRIGDAEGNITTLQQTSSSLAARLTDAEGNITTLTATVSGLQTTVTNVQGDVSSVTQLANALQVRMTNAEGDISSLTQTASSLQSTVSSLRFDFDNLQIGGRNLIRNGDFSKGLEHWRSNGSISLVNVDGKEAIKLTGTTNGFYQRPTNLEENTYYTISFKAKSVGETSSLRVGFLNQLIARQTINVDSTWRKYTFTTTQFIDFNRDTTFHFYANNETAEGVYITEIKLEKGNRATDWTPAPEDMATQSQITQLSDAINLRVQKGDVINQINISDESILIDGKRIHITGQTTIDNGVIKSAHIESLDAGKITTGVLDAGKISVINLSANSIVGGVLQSQNSNTVFNLNTGNLTMQNANFSLGGNARILFTDDYNKIQYESIGGRLSGMGIGLSVNGYSPIAYLGTVRDGTLQIPNESFTGFMAVSKELIDDGVGQNAVIGNRFQIRNLSTGYSKGYTFDMSGNTVTMIPMTTGSYDYQIGGDNAPIHRIYVRHLNVDNYSDVRNRFNSNIGWRIETQYPGDGSGIGIRGINAGTYNYVLGKSDNRLQAIFLRTNPDVSSDERLKTDIQDLDLGLDFIKQIEVKQFRQKLTTADINQGITQNPIQYGVIAQQVKGVLADFGVQETSLINCGADGYYSAQYEQFIAPLIKSVQELDQKTADEIEFLKLKIQYLEQKIKLLEAS